MALPHSLRVLRHRTLRLFFGGQAISLVGTWMQSVAQSWLVYRLTGSAELLGLLTFVSQVPVFVLGLYGGSVADRLPRLKILMTVQTIALVQSIVLTVLTFLGAIQPWQLLALASVMGVVAAFETPARQALLAELAGADVPNAVALNSTLVNGARVVGPALAGYVVGLVGEAWCFALNAVSFLAVLQALARMEVPRTPPGPRISSRLHLRAGIDYARQKQMIRALLVLLAFSSFFAMPYSTLLPLFAAEVHGGGPELLGRFFASAGAGAMTAAVTLLMRKDMTGLARRVGLGATSLGIGLFVFPLATDPWLGQGCLFLAGFGFINQMAGTMTLLQGLAPNELRGRVVGLFLMLFTGVSPFGALIAGFAAAQFGAKHTLMVGAAVALLASVVYHLALPGIRRVALEQHPAMLPTQVP